jgi:hypothetical protein
MFSLIFGGTTYLDYYSVYSFLVAMILKFGRTLLRIYSSQIFLIVVVMWLMLAIPLYLITLWFYGAQAQRMANKMFN